MFEHKNLDGQWNRVVESTNPFLSGDVLEIRDMTAKEPQASSRRQFGVVGDRLVERCLPPESIGEKWSYDSADVPWWVSVNNPPHMGLVAEFNSHNGGKHRQAFDKENNVVGFAAEGEAIILKPGAYTTVRNKDSKEISAPTLIELRNAYFAD